MSNYVFRDHIIDVIPLQTLLTKSQILLASYPMLNKRQKTKDKRQSVLFLVVINALLVPIGELFHQLSHLANTPIPPG